MDGKIVATGITFDDVLLLPRRSAVVPAETDVATRLTRGITLNIPIVSSPMDTVTESEMAISLAQEGGLGVIHKNLSIERQAEEVDKVKRSANGIIMDPVTLPPTATVARARELMDQHNISGVPITDDGSKEGRLVIFPSWLKHTVPANDGKSERISISFNLMFKNFSETMAAPLWDATAGKEKS